MTKEFDKYVLKAEGGFLTLVEKVKGSRMVLSFQSADIAVFERINSINDFIKEQDRFLRDMEKRVKKEQAQNILIEKGRIYGRM